MVGYLRCVCRTQIECLQLILNLIEEKKKKKKCLQRQMTVQIYIGSGEQRWVVGEYAMPIILIS